MFDFVWLFILHAAEEVLIPIMRNALGSRMYAHFTCCNYWWASIQAIYAYWLSKWWSITIRVAPGKLLSYRTCMTYCWDGWKTVPRLNMQCIHYLCRNEACNNFGWHIKLQLVFCLVKMHISYPINENIHNGQFNQWTKNAHIAGQSITLKYIHTKYAQSIVRWINLKLNLAYPLGGFWGLVWDMISMQ